MPGGLRQAEVCDVSLGAETKLACYNCWFESPLVGLTRLNCALFAGRSPHKESAGRPQRLPKIPPACQ